MYQRIQRAKKTNSPFGEDQVVKWFTQCMLGLKFIHEKHILHRDLKSSNFFRRDVLIRWGTMLISPQRHLNERGSSFIPHLRWSPCYITIHVVSK